MLFFNKLLPVFLLPTGLVALLVFWALWRKKRWPLVVALTVLYLGSIPFVGARLLGWVESRYPAVAVGQVEPVDAVVVLGGILGPKAGTDFVPNFLETSERFEAGVALWQAGKAGRLVFTGARMEWKDAATTEGDELKRIAVARGVAADRIIVTREVQNTADEAAAVAALMKTNGWKRVILVTTGWHMPRSARQFKRAGVDCVIFPVDFRFDPTRKMTAIDFVPRGEAWQQTETALRECYGYLFYRFFR
ncbi:MAG: YdcF family protein [Opitutae bacterium]|nr:YdcF family protein [Opitutae bacterium]